jgi:DNA-binding MarR family transcriptional regulator
MTHSELLEKYWESIPPAWFQTRAYIRRMAAEHVGLTVEQFQVLRRIRRFGSVSALAEESRSSRSSVSKAVDALVNKGFVTRATDEEDRRHIHLALTESGNLALQTIYAQTGAWLAEKFAALTPAEAQTLSLSMDLLEKIFDPSHPK